MALCEIATIDSNKEVVLHLDRLGFETDFDWIAGTFGYFTRELMAAFMLPNNDTFVLVLYGRLRQQLGGVIPGAIIYEDPSTIPATITRGPDVPMPEAGLVDPEVARIFLFTLHEHGTSFGGWALPRVDFWAPLTPTVLYQLQHLVARGPSRNRCIDVEPAQFPTSMVDELVRLVSNLEKQVEALANQQAVCAQHRLSLEYARRIVLLVEWQWKVRPKPYVKQEQTLATATRLLAAIADLDRAAAESSPTLASEREAALELLAFLSSGSSAAPVLRETLEIMATQPTAFDHQQSDDLLDALERGFVALSLSSEAQKFVTGHLISLFQGLVESMPPELGRVLADVPGDRWSTLWDVDWRAALNALRKPGGVDDDSPLAPLVAIGKHYKTGLAVVQAGLNEGTLPILLARLSTAATTPAEMQELVHSLATCVMRGIIVSGRSHRGAPNEIFFAAKDVTGWLRACAAALERGDEIDMKKVGAELRALKLGSALKTARWVSGTSFLFAVVSTLVACEATWDGTWQSGSRLIGETLKATESLSKLVYAFKLQSEIEEHLGGIKQFGERLSAMTAIVGFIITAGDTVERWRYMKVEYKFAAVLSTTGASVSLAAVLPVVRSCARLAVGLTVVGFVLGALQLAWALYLDKITPGTKKLFEQYIDFALKGDVYRSSSSASEFAAVTTEMTKALSGVLFVELRGPEGERGHSPDGGYPTWQLAHAMGFPAELVAPMFGQDIMDVIAAGIPLGPGYEGLAGASASPHGGRDV